MENNVQVVQDAYGKFTSGDIEGLLNLLSEDVHWQTPEIENAPFGGTRRGLDGVGEFFASLAESEETTRFEPTEFIAQGDRVVVLGKYGATVRETGRSYESDWVHVFTVRDGKILNFVEFFDNALASRAFQKAVTA
jgi:ketosteroid isomerase-like protein